MAEDPNPDPEQSRFSQLATIVRSLSQSVMVGRSQLANLSGFSFQGARDMFRALGYPRVLTAREYRWRYDRGGICGRLVDAKPLATWRGGGEVVEDEDPNISTPFEEAWYELNLKFKLWPIFEQVDTLAGLGQYAIMMIGAPGTLHTPLTKMSADQMLYLQPYSQRDSIIQRLDMDTESPRFGLPITYACGRLSPPLAGISAATARTVHYTRVIHVADGLLDDRINGKPRLMNIWNLLDDLDKVVGGGAEAFWKRVDGGLHIKLDPTIADMSPGDKTKFDEQLEEYTHGLRRILKTRGVDMTELSATTSGIKDPVNTIVSLLSAATGIPQRILLGSERGELASSQDRDEWDQRIHERRVSYAGPNIVRAFIDRLIELGTLPEPANYEVRWPDLRTQSDAEKTTIAKEAAQINQYMQQTVITVDEIRDRYLDLPPLEDILEIEARPEVPGEITDPTTSQRHAMKAKRKERQLQQRRLAKWSVLTAAEKRRFIARYEAKHPEAVRAAKGKGKPWKHIHQAADRFPRAAEGSRDERLRTG